MEKRFSPASFSQQRLWFLDQLTPGSPAYNVPRAIRIIGISDALNVEALRNALEAVVTRHESLRTTFDMIDEQLVQVIAPPCPFPLRVVDLTALPEPQRHVEALRLAAHQSQQPFDLRRGPLLRASLLRLSAEVYVLFLVTHHIAVDGWSLSVLFREVSVFYQAFAAGQPSPLAKPPMQYADFARWQHEYLEGDVLTEQIAYWKRQLKGPLPVLELPTDRPRPAVQSWRGASEHLTLRKGLKDALHALSQREGTTLFMTLLAAFQTLLWRYTGQDDIIVGSPIAGRNDAELEETIGFFVNTLVLRTDCSGNPTFRELLRRVREVALDAYAHDSLPFEKLVEELHPERSLGYAPLFQVMFILHNDPPQVLELPGLFTDQFEFDGGIAKFDLTLEAFEDGLSCEYSTDLFDATRITRMLGHYQTLLEGITAGPDRQLSSLPLLTAGEKRQLLVDWNDTASEYPRDRCIHALFEAQANRTPESVAIVGKDQQLTYRELNARANQLAHYLIKCGIGSGALVGICMERSLEMVIGLLAILKAGGAYVPLDPAYPKQRLAFVLEDTQAPVLLAQQGLIKDLPEHGAEVVCIDRDWEKVAQESVENPIVGTTAQDAAYVIYTSGSTGAPKGVLGSHRACVNRFCWMWNNYPFEPDEICCQKTSLSFVDSVWEIFGPMLQGVRTAIISDDTLMDPHRLVRALASERVTRIVLVPSLLRILVDSNVLLQRKLPRLKHWTTSGEALPLELAQRFLERMPESTLINLYGSSEVAADVTCHELTASKPFSRVPIGRPIANTQIHLLDRHLNLVPVGVPGEIYVGGDGLALGYLNQPALTVEMFVPNPFAERPGAHLYKTGDLGRHLPDGSVEFLGRADNQVKIRGFRIELGEIEAALNAHPGIREAVVVACEDAPGEQGLVAYLVASQETPLTASELRSFVSKKLPPYMVPSAFVVLEALPLTPNGKVDRRALPEPDHRRPKIQRPYAAPRNAIEERLAGIWGEVLKLEGIGVDDNFFELGGHSLLAIQVVGRARKAFEVELSVRNLFEDPTVAGLSGEIQRALDSGLRLRAPLLVRRNSSRRDHLLATIEELSEEQVTHLLKNMLAERGSNKSDSQD